MFSFHHQLARLAAGLDEGGQPGELGVIGLPTGVLLGLGCHLLIPLGVDHLAEPSLAAPADDGVLEFADECDRLGLRLHVHLRAAEHVLTLLEQHADGVGVTADDLTRRRGGAGRAALTVDAVCPLLPLRPGCKPSRALGEHLRALPLASRESYESVVLGLRLIDSLIAPAHILHAI